MKEIYRDDNFLVVQCPPQKRTLQFRYNDIDRSRRYELPEANILVSLKGISWMFDGKRRYVLSFSGVEMCGRVCLGDYLDQPKTLDEALTYYLDEFYHRPFTDEYIPDNPLYPSPFESFRDFLFWNAFHDDYDARPYRQHRYFDDLASPLTEEETPKTSGVVFSRYTDRWPENHDHLMGNAHLLQSLKR